MADFEITTWRKPDGDTIRLTSADRILSFKDYELVSRESAGSDDDNVALLTAYLADSTAS